MITLFKTVSQLLTAVDGIKWVDLEKGQTDNAELRPSLKFPCALVRISYPDMAEYEVGAQHITADIQVRLIFDATNAQTHGAATETQLNRSLQFLNTSDSVYQALQGYEDETYYRFSCRQQDMEVRSDGLAIIRHTYRTEFDDLRKQ